MSNFYFDLEGELINQDGKPLSGSASPPRDKLQIIQEIAYIMDRAEYRGDIKNIIIKLGVFKSEDMLNLIQDNKKDLLLKLVQRDKIEVERIVIAEQTLYGDIPQLSGWYEKEDQRYGIIYQYKSDEWVLYLHDGKVME